MNRFERSIGVCITDRDLIVRSWDPWLARATGIPAEGARGHSLAALFPDLERRGLLRRLQLVVDEGVVEVLAPALHHYLIACPPLTPSRHFEFMQQRVTIAPLRDGDSIIGAILSIEDVTERLDRERDVALEGSPGDEAPSAPVLAGALGHEDWRVRRAAVGGLAQQAGPQVVETLFRALRDEFHDLNVVNSALQTLAMLDIDTVTPLSGFLHDPDAELRTYAALALGMQKDRRAAAALIAALEDEDQNVRYHAIEALGRLRAVEARDALLATAETRDFYLAFPALDALARIGDLGVAPRIVPLLADELLRGAAVDALGDLGDEEVVAPLVALLNRPALSPEGSAASHPAVVDLSATASPSAVAGPAALAAAIAQALVRVYERYQKQYREGAYIADLVRHSVDAMGTRNLLESLAGASGEEARYLVKVVGWLEGPTVDRALAQLLGWPKVRAEVVEALVRHGAQVTELLIGQLNAEDVETRQAAVVALGRIGDRRAVPELTRVLTSDAQLMVIAAGALARIGDPRPFEALMGLLNHPEMAVRQAVISALNSLGHPAMAGRIVELLHSSDARVRESAVRVAGYFGYAECVDLLIEACHDPDESVRRAAVEHIPYLEDPRVAPTLLGALETETPRVRAAAAHALGEIETSIAIPPLLAALGDRDMWVRYAAARALAQHRSPEAVEPLAGAARLDPATPVRVAALETLGQIGGGRVVAVLAPFVDAPERDLAEATLGALGEIGHPAALAPLLASLRSPDPVHRRAAARSLGMRGGAGVAGALQWVAAADADVTVSEAAIAALGQLATPEAIAALIELATDSARREACVVSLAGVGQAHVDDVARGLAHPQPAVLRAVIDALVQMRRPEASEALGSALDHPDPDVRVAICLALARLGSRGAQRKLALLAHGDPELSVREAAEKALHK